MVQHIYLEYQPCENLHILLTAGTVGSSITKLALCDGKTLTYGSLYQHFRPLDVLSVIDFGETYRMKNILI